MHDHGHTHGDHHHHERASERPHGEHVVLELGDGVGALLVLTDPELVGTEVEISPAARDDLRQHKEVLERVANGRSLHTLVFDNLAEGDYTLWIEGLVWARGLRVRGGEIAELDRRRPGARLLAAG